MQIDERVIGEVAILDVQGQITLAEEQRLRDKVNSLLVQGRSRILVNLAAVPYVDSAGLGGARSNSSISPASSQT